MNKRSHMQLTRFALVVVTGIGVMSCADESRKSTRVAVSASALLVERTVDVIGDSYVKSGSPNQNQGSEPTIRLQSSGKNRGLLFFDPAAIRSAVQNT